MELSHRAPKSKSDINYVRCGSSSPGHIKVCLAFCYVSAGPGELTQSGKGQFSETNSDGRHPIVSFIDLPTCRAFPNAGMNFGFPEVAV
jgi:hypothetical protein